MRQAFCLQDVEWALGAIRIYYIFGLGIKPRLPLLLSSLCGAGRGIYTLRPTKARHLVYTHAASNSSLCVGSLSSVVAWQLNCCVCPLRNVTCTTYTPTVSHPQRLPPTLSHPTWQSSLYR